MKLNEETNVEEEIVTNEENFPLFLYKNRECNMNKLTEGLMENEFLLRMGIGIFISPSVATFLVSTGPKGLRSARQGKAGRHKMTEITVEAIAYVAMQARLALSSDEQFHSGGQGNFSYLLFYNTVVDVLRSDTFAPFLPHVLAVWNRRLFPDETKARREHKSMSSGTALKLLRQLCKENQIAGRRKDVW
ncbi:hypothetical protein CALCODRAFT_492905 [Calocera cornea HHB12733]|uniref:Uncharacterized protein n=1 Tax=Calocera cornea HHB12733 TaxID=1353952 RepID=A0A165I532_9BASI|nr:hypothetical protein CALCODRAFT_492905 [Calocera cornea HHB12733]